MAIGTARSRRLLYASTLLLSRAPCSHASPSYTVIFPSSGSYLGNEDFDAVCTQEGQDSSLPSLGTGWQYVALVCKTSKLPLASLMVPNSTYVDVELNTLPLSFTAMSPIANFPIWDSKGTDFLDTTRFWSGCDSDAGDAQYVQSCDNFRSSVFNQYANMGQLALGFDDSISSRGCDQASPVLCARTLPIPTESPTQSPTETPSASPTVNPADSPSTSPTTSPSVSPSTAPSASPTDTPSRSPTIAPTTPVCSLVSLTGSNIVLTNCTEAEAAGGGFGLAPAPPPDGGGDNGGPGFIVSPTVGIEECSNLTSPIGQTCPEAEGGVYVFTLPQDPAKTEKATRLLETTDCEAARVACEWQDPATLTWSDSGCVSVDTPSGVECRCDHLTVFALVIRSQLNARPLCNVGAEGYVLASLYLIGLLAASYQLVRLVSVAFNRCKRGGRSRDKKVKATGRVLLIQHGGLVGALLLRIMTLSLQPVLPLVLQVVLELSASVIILSVLIFLTFSWASVFLFPFSLKPPRQLLIPFRVCIGLLLSTALVLPIALAVALGKEEGAVTVTIASVGAYLYAFLTATTCVFLCVFGFGVARMLTRSAGATAAATTKAAPSQSTLPRETSKSSNSPAATNLRLANVIRRVSAALGLALSIQAILWASDASASSSSVAALDASDAVFSLLDLCAVASLLLLYHRSVAKACAPDAAPPTIDRTKRSTSRRNPNKKTSSVSNAPDSAAFDGEGGVEMVSLGDSTVV